MNWDGIAVLAIFMVMSVALTWLAVSTNMILFRIGASLSWLVMGMSLLLGMVGIDWTQPYAQVLGILCIVMAIAPLLLQMVTETEREKNGVRWKEWSRNPGGPKASRGKASRESYKSQIRRSAGRSGRSSIKSKSIGSWR